MALQQLSIPTPIADFSLDDASQTITLTAPPDVQERLRVTLPLEVRDRQHRYTLCADPARVAAAIEQAAHATAGEESWPRLHYLWPQHPIMHWLSERVLTTFDRRSAPVIQCPALADSEQAFILMGSIFNHKGQPLRVEWQVAVWSNEAWRLQAFPDFVDRTQLKAGSLINRAQDIDITSLQANLPGAVSVMQRHMLTLQHRLSADLTVRLAGTMADLERLQGQQIEQLAVRLEKNQRAETLKKSRREQRKQQIAQVFDEYRQSVKNTLGLEAQPFVQVLAAAVP
jgi:hypothetical protein